MTHDEIKGCDVCADPLNVTLQREHEIRRLSGTIAVFRCPQCACLILDDITGWKGSGVVFRATEEMIATYARENGVPESLLLEKSGKPRPVDKQTEES